MVLSFGNLRIVARGGISSETVGAQRAIANFAKQGKEFEFNPDDKDQITAYLQLRQFNKRVTADALIWSCKNSKTSIDSSASQRLEYYGVPKTNFPNGLPARIQSSELCAAEIEEMEMMGGGDIDTDAYYIIDCQVPRSDLGKKVVTFEFSTKKKTKRRTSSGGAAFASKGADETDKLENVPSGSLATSQNVPSGSLAMSRNVADTLAASQNVPSGSLAMSRGVKREHSDVIPDGAAAETKKGKALTDTMRSLKEGIVMAMDAGRWRSEHSLQTDNVKFLLDEFIAVFQDMKASQLFSNVKAFALKLAAWLANEFLSRPVFEELEVFKGAFERVLTSDIVDLVTDEDDQECVQMVKLIESLASVPSTAINAMPDFPLASVACRTRFRSSALYLSFVSSKVDLTLKLAKGSTDPEQRVALLKSVRDVPRVSEGTKITINVVSTLFDTRASLMTRLEYMANARDESVLKLAMHWDPDGVIGFNAMCLSEKADLTGKPYIHFQSFAELLIASECDLKVPNPLCAASVQFLQAVWDLDASGTSPQGMAGTWQQYTVASSLQARLGFAVDDDMMEKDFDPENEIPAKLSNEAFKLIREFLKPVKSPPSWFAQWKEKRSTQRAKPKDREEEAQGQVKEEGEAKGEASATQVEAEDEGEANGDDGAPGESPMYKKDDILIGVATKFKEKYDQQECKVVAVLSKKYKVEMLTGPATGEVHKYFFHSVRSAKKESPEEGPAVTESVHASVEEKEAVEELLDMFND